MLFSGLTVHSSTSIHFLKSFLIIRFKLIPKSSTPSNDTICVKGEITVPTTINNIDTASGNRLAFQRNESNSILGYTLIMITQLRNLIRYFGIYLVSSQTSHILAQSCKSIIMCDSSAKQIKV